VSRPAAELERRVGGRVLRAGQVVRVTGARGLFRIQRFRGDEVDMFGGPPGREHCRVFKVDRIGARPRAANSSVLVEERRDAVRTC